MNSFFHTAIVKIDSIDPVFFLQLLAGLALILALILLASKVKALFTEKKPSRVTVENDDLKVSKSVEVATKTEVYQMGYRLEGDIKEIREDLAEQRKNAREALGKVHARIDQLATNSDTISGTLGSVAENVKLLLQKALENGGEKS